MPSRFDSQVVFITGASSGIGEALAEAFAEQGAAVAMAGRRTDRLEKIAAKLHSGGFKALPLTCDVTSENQVNEAVLKTVSKFGKLNVMIANAGFGVAGNVEQLKPLDFRRQFETNVFGVLHSIYAALPHLIASRGTLVLLGSISGYISLPGVAPYSMSKAAVHALAEALRHELRPHGVSVVLIAPGFVDSEIRRVNNEGALNLKAKDPIPAWLKMPAHRAARIIANATYKRKPSQVVTLHGKLAVAVQRFFPWMIQAALRMGVRGRKEPKNVPSGTSS